MSLYCALHWYGKLGQLFILTSEFPSPASSEKKVVKGRIRLICLADRTKRWRAMAFSEHATVSSERKVTIPLVCNQRLSATPADYGCQRHLSIKSSAFWQCQSAENLATSLPI